MNEGTVYVTPGATDIVLPGAALIQPLAAVVEAVIFPLLSTQT